MLETIIIGRIGQNPEIKYFESGKVKTSFSVATNRWDAKTKAEVTDWFNVECWDKLAESVGEHFKKGTSVVVQGELKRNDYTTQNGEEKIRWTINAKSVKYSNAFLTIAGEIEKIEERFTSSDKKVQYIKLKDCDIPIHNFSEVDITKGDYKTFLCTLGMNEHKPFATALKIDAERVKSNNQMSDDELIGEDEIPF